jgi:hypothetical protein
MHVDGTAPRLLVATVGFFAVLQMVFASMLWLPAALTRAVSQCCPRGLGKACYEDDKRVSGLIEIFPFDEFLNVPANVVTYQADF